MGSEGPTLRQLAITVWHVWSPRSTSTREAVESKQRRRIERFRAELFKIIGETVEINIRINGGCVEAKVEDLRFIAFEIPSSEQSGYMTLVTLLGRCPSCGTETMSEPIYNLAGVGKMLESFEPIRRHLCYNDHK
jgi:hypothetical protein